MPPSALARLLGWGEWYVSYRVYIISWTARRNQWTFFCDHLDSKEFLPVFFLPTFLTTFVSSFHFYESFLCNVSSCSHSFSLIFLFIFLFSNFFFLSFFSIFLSYFTHRFILIFIFFIAFFKNSLVYNYDTYVVLLTLLLIYNKEYICW